MENSFFYGLQDAFSPLQFTTLWVLVLLLSFRGITVWRIFGVSFFYLISVFCAYFTAYFGGYDGYFVDQIVVNAIRNVYVLFGCFFIIIGVLSIIDWIRLNFTSSTRLIIRAPVSLISEKLKINMLPRSMILRMCIIPAFIGWFMAFLSMLWQEEFVFNAFSYFLSGKDSRFTFGIYSLYLLGQLTPFIFVCFIFEMFLKVKRFQDVAMSAVKIITAAVSFGLGINLILLRFI